MFLLFLTQLLLVNSAPIEDIVQMGTLYYNHFESIKFNLTAVYSLYPNCTILITCKFYLPVYNGLCAYSSSRLNAQQFVNYQQIENMNENFFYDIDNFNMNQSFQYIIIRNHPVENSVNFNPVAFNILQVP